jgi:hypothetical protein
MFACLFALSHAQFLKAQPKESNESLSEQDIKTSLLEEIESTFGTSASTRLAKMEKALESLFKALPKNAHGNLGHATVRYALHRLFMRRHGWSIKGLSPNGDGWNSSSPAGVLKGQVPTYIQNLFEQRLGDKGFGLRDLAVFASTIEHMVHTEAVGKLGAIFNMYSLLPMATLQEKLTTEVLETYMMQFILGQDISHLSPRQARKLEHEMPKLFMTWEGTKVFLQGLLANATKNQPKTFTLPSVNFALLANVVENIGEEFGSFQDTDCQQLKQTLMNVEYRGTGRVKLADFYKPALNHGSSKGGWQFQESAAYLKKLGALDDSDPQAKSVVIANYIQSATNCITASGFYQICCKDHCEDLLGHLEEKLAVPEASPSKIAALIAKLPSATVQAPRELSAYLLRRLDDIAEGNGGVVPIHGRLFAQWMHHAFPRECSYPPVANTTSQQRGSEYGKDSIAGEAEMRKHSASSIATFPSNDERGEAILPWSPEEELLAAQSMPIMASPDDGSKHVRRSIVLLISAGSLAFGLIQSMKGLLLDARTTHQKEKWSE